MTRQETRQLFYKLKNRVIYPNDDWKKAFDFYNEYMKEKVKMNCWLDYSPCYPHKQGNLQQRQRIKKQNSPTERRRNGTRNRIT